MKLAFNIPNIAQSLKKDYQEGRISMEDVAYELWEANLIPYVCTEKAAQKIGSISGMTKEQLKRIDPSFTDTGIPYILDGIQKDGGNYTLLIPKNWNLSANQIEKEKAYIRDQHDVVSLKIKRIDFQP